jgi:hypothetical protein
VHGSGRLGSWYLSNTILRHNLILIASGKTKDKLQTSSQKEKSYDLALCRLFCHIVIKTILTASAAPPTTTHRPPQASTVHHLPLPLPWYYDRASGQQ